jgi:hypothetical protein
MRYTFRAHGNGKPRYVTSRKKNCTSRQPTLACKNLMQKMCMEVAQCVCMCNLWPITISCSCMRCAAQSAPPPTHTWWCSHSLLMGVRTVHHHPTHTWWFTHSLYGFAHRVHHPTHTCWCTHSLYGCAHRVHHHPPHTHGV